MSTKKVLEVKRPHVVATADLPGISILVKSDSSSYRQVKAVGFTEKGKMAKVIIDKQIISMSIDLVAYGYQARVMELPPLEMNVPA